ncbi:hypothetical protein FCOIX_11967 [Fusarium coicis]|nr:hypothetical protein FCOIX_11967 [Fusarium coicis]
MIKQHQIRAIPLPDFDLRTMIDFAVDETIAIPRLPLCIRDRRDAEHNLTDEDIHLTSGFQLLGFHHVIGTLWAVGDSLCVEIARLVYEEPRDRRKTDRATVSQGLRKATRKLRDAWLDIQDSNQYRISIEINGGQENAMSANMKDIVPI